MSSVNRMLGAADVRHRESLSVEVITCRMTCVVIEASYSLYLFHSHHLLCDSKKKSD